MSEQRFKLRIPTVSEWDQLVDATNGNDTKMHWKSMYSWCQDSNENEKPLRVVRGYDLARSSTFLLASHKNAFLGFRPVLEPLDHDTLSQLKDGAVVSFAALTMDIYSLPYPENPVTLYKNGDIPVFIGGSALDIQAIPEEATNQIRWVKCGDILIADRNLLCNISWNELDRQGLVSGREVTLTLSHEIPRMSLYNMAQQFYAQMEAMQRENDGAYCIARNIMYLTNHCEPNEEIPQEDLLCLATRIYETNSASNAPLLNEERLDSVRYLLENGMGDTLNPADTLNFLLQCSDDAFLYAVEDRAYANEELYGEDHQYGYDDVGEEILLKELEDFTKTTEKPALSELLTQAQSRSEAHSIAGQLCADLQNEGKCKQDNAESGR